MTQKNKLFLKIAVGVAATLAAIFILAVLVFNIFTKAPAGKNLRHSKKGFVIPYSNKGYIAQGISYDESSGNFYLTGYMKDGSASPIFVVNKETRKLVNAVRMTKPDGSAFTGHAGGLSVADGKIYIAGSADCCFYVFDKSDVDNAERNANISYTDVVDVNNNSNQNVVIREDSSQNNYGMDNLNIQFSGSLGSYSNQSEGQGERYKLYVTKYCPNCSRAKEILDRAGVAYDVVDAQTVPAECARLGIMQAPTLVVDSNHKYTNVSNIIRFVESNAYKI